MERSRPPSEEQQKFSASFLREVRSEQVASFSKKQESHASVPEDNQEPAEFKRLEPKNNTSQNKRPPISLAESRIRTTYNGILSSKLQWNTERFSRLAAEGDLRTSVTIVRGGALLQMNYSPLGEVAILKGLGDTFELFRKDAVLGETVDVSFNIESGRAEIKIHDQAIQQKIMQRKGKFDEQAFLRELNENIYLGLTHIFQSEKKHQILYSSLIDGMLGIEGGLYWGLSKIFIEGNFYIPFEILIIFGGVMSFVSHFLILFKHIKLGTAKPYFTSMGDCCNPFKHVKDLLFAKLSLLGKKNFAQLL